MQLNEIEMKED